MAFPDVPRVTYERNPLDQVICQLRFPPILKIDSEPPFHFQDKIGGEYPIYQDRPAIVPPGLPADLVLLMSRDAAFGSGQRAHDFVSRDKNWTVGLTREFLSLTCGAYDRWESFKAHLSLPMSSLLALYRIPFFTRIGLRYRDVIRRSRLELVGVPWSELIQPWIAGLLSRPDIGTEIEQTAQSVLIKLPDGHSQLRVQHGLAQDEASKEVCYLIDADFFTESPTEPPDASTRLDFLNLQSRLFFRWCIQDRLHRAMRPQPITIG